jgi:cell division protein FtsZ
MGMAIMGTGVADGQSRAVEAARAAISSPLLEDASVRGARGVIINVTGGPDLSLVEVSEASAIIQEAAHEEANIIFGAVVDHKMSGKVKITVIATGFDRETTFGKGSQSETPVDLEAYTSWRDEQDERVAAAGAADHGGVAIARRAAIELPAQPELRAVEMAETPGPEFEPLDVPAFLRRQTEA